MKVFPTPLAATSAANSNLLGGADLLQLLVLAFGAALVVGNGLALLRSRRPVPAARSGEPEAVQPPLGRSLVMIVVGLLAVMWAVATLMA